MTDYLNIVEEYVKKSFMRDDKLRARGLHLLKTKEWLLKIYPDADKAMQIAAIAHDIDSAFVTYGFEGGFKSPTYLEKHQNAAAEELARFLKENGANSTLIKKVKHLVEKHEVGGDNEQNIIKDADSLGFFDRDMPDFINRHSKKGAAPDDIREKIDWMYNRITGSDAKEIAKPMYVDALKLLESK